jgi:hypothetical protein
MAHAAHPGRALLSGRAGSVLPDDPRAPVLLLDAGAGERGGHGFRDGAARRPTDSA